MVRSLWPAALVTALFCAKSSSAQNSQAAPARHCSETLIPVDTVREVFELHVEEHQIWRGIPPAGLSTDYLTSVATAVARHMTFPVIAESDVFVPDSAEGSLPRVARRSAGSAAVFTLRKDGQVADVAVRGPGHSGVMEQALARAVLRTHSAGEMPQLPAGLKREEVTLEISLTSRRHDEGAPDTLAHLPAHDRSSRRVAVGFGHVEGYRLDRVVRPRARTQQVYFPGEGRLAGVGDSVLVEFIVNENGRVERDRATLISANYREFARAVVDGMPAMRFEPMMSGACALRSVVRQAFVFRIR